MAVWKKIGSTLRILFITIVILTILGIVLVLVAYSLPVIIGIAVIGLTIFVVMLLTYEEVPDEDEKSKFGCSDLSVSQYYEVIGTLG